NAVSAWSDDRTKPWSKSQDGPSQAFSDADAFARGAADRRAGRCPGSELEPDARTDLERGRVDSGGQHARIRYRAEPVEPGYRFRRRCRAWADPGESPRRDPGPGHGSGDLPESGGGGPPARLPGPGARLRFLQIRPAAAAVPAAGGARSGSGGCAGGA